MTRIYFVRHAQPDYRHIGDSTRPLTAEGRADTKAVLAFFLDKKVDLFYSSPYKRSYDMVAPTAAFFGKRIITDRRFREREKGAGSNYYGMFQKRWNDFDYHEPDGESLGSVQRRNIEALTDILRTHRGKTVVIGTHGTALSTVLNYYDLSFKCEDFLRIIDWMPYIIELDFEGEKLIEKKEHFHIEKEYKGKNRADKPFKHEALGKKVTVTVDRPLGSYHPKHPDMLYTVNYGYIKGTIVPDGEEQDAYILGVNEPVEVFTGKVIAVIHRKNDVEEKWVVCPEKMMFSADQIKEQTYFTEQYFDSEIMM